MKPIRIQLSRRAGFNLQRISRDLNGLQAVNCSRPGRYGNRYVVGGNPCLHIDGEIHYVPDAATAVRLHREELEYWLRVKPKETMLALKPLRGKNLACWSQRSARCHCDVLLDLANR